MSDRARLAWIALWLAATAWNFGCALVDRRKGDDIRFAIDVAFFVFSSANLAAHSAKVVWSMQ